MVQFIPASDIICANPHPLFDRLAERGYELWYLFRTYSCGDGMRGLDVQVRLDRVVVAAADFEEDGPDRVFCQNVKVLPEFHRQKIANAIYVFAEKATGRTMYNLWGGPTDAPEVKR